MFHLRQFYPSPDAGGEMSSSFLLANQQGSSSEANLPTYLGTYTPIRKVLWLGQLCLDVVRISRALLRTLKYVLKCLYHVLLRTLLSVAPYPVPPSQARPVRLADACAQCIECACDFAWGLQRLGANWLAQSPLVVLGGRLQCPPTNRTHPCPGPVSRLT